ncbi:N-acetylglucosamine-6-phosphate deacetylase [Acuticoccus sp. MNP-M23]|uniref:N-acetylglucosamine-6-phosphate deacetylase n=1 Tax=Acuticoccus sp. MNP-M23 TaxID=3072793 RepID=UPI0028169832|nr:N-acetylglucosamine-6-phosphate deacetylase [Acuticoccus sp. MNP-M23]WMS42645.1 N-acetylglucosamine-6-phosphate deacetylase [Acuticoccus sp. MNP-M23]
MSAFVGDGLFDLQVNGYAGVDFNDPSIGPAAMDIALEAMRAAGVTGCLPTIITAHEGELVERFRALDAAVTGSRLGAEMVPGYHLEGPFLNPDDGYRGVHPAAAMGDPDIALVDTLEAGLSRPILLVTFAPERAGAAAFARALAQRGKAMGMAHSAAGFADVRAAADAGLTLSTHLGNGLPQTLPKLENTFLAQLAEKRLTACVIADGHHMSPDALSAIVALKGTSRTILVTDAVLAAAAPAGHYRFAGMDVKRTDAGAVVPAEGANLAGSALTLDDAVRNVVRWGVADLPTAVAMAAAQPRAALQVALDHHSIRLDPGRVAWSDALEPSPAA